MTPTLDVDPPAPSRGGTDGDDDDLSVGPSLLQAAVRVADSRWIDLQPAAIAELVMSAVAGSPITPPCPATCDLLFGDDAQMAELNGRFRMRAQPTNVLAFPSGETMERGVPIFLGGIALSYDRVVAEAIERRIPQTAHATHLTLHGLMHLLGYDHEIDADRDEMERIEVAILAGLGIDDPYEGS